MSTPKIEVILSDCCDAPLTPNSYDTCSKCGEPCQGLSHMEEFYDEVRADDERNQETEK